MLFLGECLIVPDVESWSHFVANEQTHSVQATLVFKPFVSFFFHSPEEHAELVIQRRGGCIIKAGRSAFWIFQEETPDHANSFFFVFPPPVRKQPSRVSSSAPFGRVQPTYCKP